MERRGGCCIARYGGDADVAWKVGRIMVKFRPIAPKPAAAGSLNGGAPESSIGERAGGRGKRKWGGREGRRGRKARKGSDYKASGAFREGEEKKEQNSSVVTLPLMPETPERKEKDSLLPSPTTSDPAVHWPGEGHVAAVVVAPRPADSWVTMECVTDTWRDGEVDGGNDEEVRRGLELDGCPGFVSDGEDRVTWTNAAYQRMVVGSTADGEDEEEEEGVRVALATKGLVPGIVTCRAFTCRVRVRYACRRRGRVSMAVPCDVWRLAGGGLAWRLDLQTALSLSLLN